MSAREISELENGTHPAIRELDEALDMARLHVEGPAAAETHLADCREACDVAADASYDLQAIVTRELLCAEAVAKEWGVYS